MQDSSYEMDRMDKKLYYSKMIQKEIETLSMDKGEVLTDDVRPNSVEFKTKPNFPKNFRQEVIIAWEWWGWKLPFVIVYKIPLKIYYYLRNKY